MDLTLRFYSKNKHLLRKQLKAMLTQTTTLKVQVYNPSITRVCAYWKREFDQTVIGQLGLDVSIGGYSLAKKPIWVFLTTTGKLYFPRGMGYNDGELIEVVENWVWDCYRELNGQSKMKRFWETAKEELIAAVWHPDRVAKWVEAGVELETL